MKGKLYGNRPTPAVAVAGTWDMLTPGQCALLHLLMVHAREQDMAAVAILLDPPPAVFIHGAGNYPIYQSPSARIARLLALGLDAVVRIDFEESDLKETAATFFGEVVCHQPLAEFWLRPGQTLGSGSRGSLLGIMLASKKYGFKLTRLSELPQAFSTTKVQQHLAAGAIRQASALARHPPVVARPTQGPCLLAWPPGRYSAFPLTAPLAAPHTPALTVNLVAQQDGLSMLMWPETTVPFLAFASGPGDDPVLDKADESALHGAVAPPFPVVRNTTPVLT